MKIIQGNRLQSLILSAEAVLIILSLAAGSNAWVGMACYWAIIAVYHLTAFFTAGRGENTDEDGEHADDDCDD